ncbi:MAG: patatin family protein [Anaerolineales bacterium]
MSAYPRPIVGLALGGGVVRGLAHLGVLQTLIEADIPIDIVAGTSAGALMGALYLGGVPLKTGLDLARRTRWAQLVSPVWPRRGLVSSKKMETWLHRQIGDPFFADLPRPFATVALDIQSGERIVFRKGPVAPAVRASCTVAGFMEPMDWHGRQLVDGSFIDTLPVSVARDLGAEYVIGVNIFVPHLRRRWGAWGYLFSVIERMVQNAGGGIQKADCLISPALAGKTYLRFSQADRLYQAGREAAQAALPHLRTDLGLA